MKQRESQHKVVPTANKSGEAGSDDGRDDTPESLKPRQPKEVGGRDGPDPTRFGDWEKAGRCIDF